MIINKIMNKTVKRHIDFNYTVYTPDNYSNDKKFPLVVYLHGAGERSDDIEDVSKLGFLKEVKNGKDYPFLIAAPQCPMYKYWGNYLESLNDFLDYIIENYNVDTEHIYLTGLSMGGTGTWHWLMANPERFAAAAPICGTGIYWYACNIYKKPIWIFHGAIDRTVPVEESIAMYKKLIDCGGKPKLTIYENVDHNAWDYAYNDELANWFMQF